jgi:hypothetical protein
MMRDNRLWLLFAGLALVLTVACSGTSGDGSGGDDAAEGAPDSMTQG